MTMRKLSCLLCLTIRVFGVISWSSKNNGKNRGGEHANNFWKRRDWLTTAGTAAASSIGVLVSSPAPSLAVIPSLAKEYGGLPVATNPSAGQVSFPALTPPFFRRARFDTPWAAMLGHSNSCSHLLMSRLRFGAM